MSYNKKHTCKFGYTNQSEKESAKKKKRPRATMIKQMIKQTI